MELPLDAITLRKKKAPRSRIVPADNRPPNLPSERESRPGVPLPLYQHTTTRANGDHEERTFGPAVVQCIRWLVVLILGIVMIWKSPSTSNIVGPFLKWLAALK
jgi:hypothetical protein